MYDDRWIQALVDVYDEKHGIVPEVRPVPSPLPCFSSEDILFDATPTNALLVGRDCPEASEEPTTLPWQNCPDVLTADALKKSPRRRRRLFAALGAMTAAVALWVAVFALRAQPPAQAQVAVDAESAFNRLGAIVQTEDGVTPEQLPIAATDLSPVIIGLSEHPEELTAKDIIIEESVNLAYEVAPASGPDDRLEHASEEPSAEAEATAKVEQ